MTKEWLEQKAAFEARIEALEQQIALMLDEGKGKGIHLIEQPASKIVVPGQPPAGGLKIVNVGFSHHQAMHALIQALGFCHQDMMMQQAQQAIDMGQNIPSGLSGLKLVQ